NLILRYSAPLERVLDPMMGGGTTLVECRLLRRNGIGIDLNPSAVMVARDRLAFAHPRLVPPRDMDARTFIGDARRLDLIVDQTIDLIVIHPPYANIIRYSRGTGEGDLSEIMELKAYR